MNYLGIDIGGTWLKAVTIKYTVGLSLKDIPVMTQNAKITRVRSRLGVNSTITDFVGALDELLQKAVPKGESVCGIGISTAGIVDYAGKRLVLSAPHLRVLTDSYWIDYLKQTTGAVVTLLNDADAAAIGAAYSGYLSGNATVGIMPVGTGLGFTVWRNGRKWTPQFAYTLLGSIFTPEGGYDSIGGVPALVGEDGDLQKILSEPEYQSRRDTYINNLMGIISSAAIIYGIDKILIGGGLADAVRESGFPLADKLKAQLRKNNLLDTAKTEVEVMPEGNLLPLTGALLIAVGEENAQKTHCKKDSNIPYDSTLHLENMDSKKLVHRLWQAEQEADDGLELSLDAVSETVDELVKRLASGGRLIYVGCGTIGRLAAIDALEIACTFGFPADRVLSFISGGLADASIEIESRFEKDASAVPEMLLADIRTNDTVIGISVGGQEYYVQSALGFARYTGAYTVMIQEEAADSLPFCDKAIALRTGNELFAGSIRMKVGKILNIISTSAMKLLSH
ncbi:MAG: ROK family protein [Tannerella sp.]|jgi:N-acetylmuramic acid 6-phosphate (MurNAc-6-P) etherase/predicted NBD/HSP70 family sugar kinase|nr:ROK family protein [Tannerella sp.]